MTGGVNSACAEMKLTRASKSSLAAVAADGDPIVDVQLGRIACGTKKRTLMLFGGSRDTIGRPACTISPTRK